MPVTIASLAVNPYVVGANQIINDVAATRGEHKMYDSDDARINITWTPDLKNPKVKMFAGVLAATGSAYYLPYNDNKITSVRLPNPPPGGVDFFLTANMSGCKLFIDTITGSPDLMVYHANTHMHGSPAHNSPVNFQNPLADTELNRLHTMAVADYAGLPAPNNLALVNVATLAKPTYYGNGALAETHKANQGRTLTIPGPTIVTPEFVGGCSVFGFFNGGWSFYYQTWGDVGYDRPVSTKLVAKALVTGHWNYVHKARVEGARHVAAYDTSKVVDHALIY